MRNGVMGLTESMRQPELAVALTNVVTKGARDKWQMASSRGVKEGLRRLGRRICRRHERAHLGDRCPQAIVGADG